MKPGVEDALGRIEFYAHLKKPRSASLTRKRIFLTVVSESDDEILAAQGVAELRKTRIVRLCGEASEQDALLAYDDLTVLLLTSLSTIKRDLAYLRKHGMPVPIHRKKQRASKEGNATSFGS